MANRQERKARTATKKAIAQEATQKEAILNQVLEAQSKLSKLEKAQAALQGLRDRKFKMMFFVPETRGMASGAVIEIYNQAAVLRRQGFDTVMLAERKDYVAPAYLDQELQAMPHLYAEGVTFPVAPEDWLIIPEFYTPLMEQTKKMSCTRVVLAQSYTYTIESNLGGMTWKDLGMDYVITTSERMKEFIQEWHGKNLYDIQTYTLGVPEYFKPSAIKKPVVAFFSRNADDIKRMSKLFYYKFPELQWVVFDDLRGTTRQEFAKKLGEAQVCLFLDRIAGFGQPAIEAMKSETVVVALAPDIIPEYMIENSGVWSADYYQVPELLGNVFKRLISDEFPEEILDTMKSVANHYSVENSEASILAAYQHFLTKREETLVEAVEIAEKMENQLKSEQEAAQK